MQWVLWVASGFLVDSDGGLIHGGSGSVVGWLAEVVVGFLCIPVG